MASKGDDSKKATGTAGAPQEREAPVSQAFYDPIIKDETQFPTPQLYFKVFDSEVDEPEAKVRRDVNKLYERWTKKYGRPWPENGMNTEDLVWLAEEAYKPEVQLDERGNKAYRPPGPANLANLKTIEDERYPNEFMEIPGTSTAPGAKGKKGQANMSNYEATAAGGNWATDEFESGDYEAGNLEQLWGMHLFDYESKPTMMPDGPADEAQGEESEDWDDFYGSYRPRHIDTDDAREAVWATDEFESDEDNTESEWEAEYVGAGLGLKNEDPFNPQYSLRHSNHPLAPFPGEALKWTSMVYDDGTTYEGLTRDAVPHGMGVMTFGNGTGGGFHFRDVRRGDKYEGEFQVGYAHGLGQFSSETKGEVYIGEFFAGQKHGCGIRIDMQPYYYLLARGEDPVAAYQKTHEQIMRNIEFRTWYRNKALGSDHEDEVVLHAVRDDFDDPAAVVLKNMRHDAKLREWAAMDTTEKALLKAVEIIEGVRVDRMKRNGGRMRSHYQRGEDGAIHEVLDTENDDTDFDSVELMVGIDSDGFPGIGWTGDTQDTELYPYDEKLAEQLMADAAEDKAEEEEDKEAILGEDLVNPFTGLTLRDYLDGREGVYKEMMRRSGAMDRLLGAAQAPPASKQRKKLASAADAEASSYVDDTATWSQKELERQLNDQLSKSEQARAAAMLRRSRQAYGDDGGALGGQRNPWSEDTDTRFETESEMMELCELAEILGTVDEAREVVTKARMWRWKPDGDVTYRFAQDANGSPLPLMQDPMHYPHGTKFMAPGPLGQVHPIPNDAAIRAEMIRAAKNYSYIHSLYNFDYDPLPGTVQYKIDQRIKRAGELQMQALAGMAEAAEAELAAERAASGANPQMALAEASEAVAASQQQSGSQQGPSRPVFGSVTVGSMSAPFASMSMGMSKASKVMLNALTSAAKHAPSRRPHITRPSQMRRKAAATATTASSQ